MPDELHVSSLLVHARPELAATISAAIAGAAGAEVRAVRDGRIIVVLETDSEQAILAHIHRIGELPGVMSTALIFHQVEPGAREQEGTQP